MASEVDSQESQKEVAFYSAMVTAWVGTRMEKDKTLLTRAIGGIGLLVTLLTTVGPSSGTELWLYAVAGLSFGLAAVTAICVFDRNSDHLFDVIRNKKTGEDERLQVLDQIVFFSFVTGVVLTGAIALSAGSSRMHRKAASVTQENRETATIPATIMEHKSLSGIGNLAPTQTPQPAANGQGGGGTTGTQGQTGGPSQGSPK
jgi:hypothetical protein